MKKTPLWLDRSELTFRFYGFSLAMLLFLIAGLSLLWFGGDIATTHCLYDWPISIIYHSTLQFISADTMYFFYVFFGLVILYATVKRLTWQKHVALGWLWAELSGSVCITLIKVLTGRGRPNHMWHKGFTDDWIGPTLNAAYHSFPSGHTFDLWISATFFLFLIRSPALCIIAWILALLVAFSRIALAMHYVSDVLAGSVLATLFIALWFRNNFIRA